MTQFSVRPAEDTDAQVLLEWRNDTETMLWARNNAEIAWPHHLRWFRSVLAADDRILRVVEAGGRPVASVRYDRDPAHTSAVQVSIVVAHTARGQGVGITALQLGEAELRACWPDVRKIVAVVHRDNAASRRLFAKAGYGVRVEGDPWVTLTKTSLSPARQTAERRPL